MSKNILVGAVIIAGVWIYATGKGIPMSPSLPPLASTLGVYGERPLEEKVLPSAGVVLPVRWDDLGKQLTAAGVIDEKKFERLYADRGGLTAEMESMLYGEDNGQIKITNENSGLILNLLWALGLGTKNEILEKGPMADPAYGGAANFASTGGWTLAKGETMNHYSRHQFFNLTPEQQKMVERVSKNIYRPCCGNSTYFPDCNHGMAMLGLLELMASQGVGESEMYKASLAVNSYWFPDTYLTIATYMKNKGIDWQDVNPQEILDADYSSGQGYARIVSLVTAPGNSRGGSSCGIDTGASVAPQRQSSGCGVDAGQPAPSLAPRQQTGCGI